MSQTYANNDNVLSKVKFGNTTYYLKDAAARAIMDTFGNVVTFDKATIVTQNGTGVVDAGLMYDYVGRQIGAIGQALNLLPEANHATVENPQSGDFVVESDGKEWLFDGEEWRVVGDENTYVAKTTTIAGLDLQDDITKAQLQEALELGSLAYLDTGSVKITTIDSFNSFDTGAAGTYTVEGTAVSVPATYTALDVTPAGSVTIEAGTAAAATYDKTTGISVSSSAATESAPANYTPSGTVSVTNVTVNPATVPVATVTEAGEEYQLSPGSLTHATDTTSNFATEGVVASIDPEDAEALVLTTAGTSAAVTAVGAITYTDPTLSGSLPVFGSESVVKSITSASATASFSGDGTVIAASPTYSTADATVTQPTFTGSFSGTTKSVTPVAATTTSAAPANATITVTSESITPTATSTEKTATVTFAKNA